MSYLLCTQVRMCEEAIIYLSFIKVCVYFRSMRFISSAIHEKFNNVSPDLHERTSIWTYIKGTYMYRPECTISTGYWSIIIAYMYSCLTLLCDGVYPEHRDGARTPNSISIDTNCTIQMFILFA